jgi:hypothetical protein
MDICVTPGHSRPEMFEVWSELVQKCTGARDIYFLFCLDHGYDTRYLDLIYKFPFECSYIEMPKTNYTLGKQSNNVLNGMCAAARHADNLVYYLEEDIFPGVDFFRWHQEIHKREKEIYCSIATHCNDTHYDFDIVPSNYYLTSEPDYQSWGSCFRKEMILKMIYPHFNDNYLNNPTGYCLNHFNSYLGGRFTEQDGLIKRILEKSGMQVAYPCYPFAYHAGIYGYNRQAQIMKLPYDKKLKLIRETVFDIEKMLKITAPFTDSVPVDLDVKFGTLEKVTVSKIN